MAILYDDTTGTTLTLSPNDLFVVDTDEMATVTKNPNFADDLDAEDDAAQNLTRVYATSLANIAPTLAHATRTVRAEELIVGDILVDGNAWVPVIENRGESQVLTGYQIIITLFGPLTINRGRNLNVIRGA